jgi:hypothetical protein
MAKEEREMKTPPKPSHRCNYCGAYDGPAHAQSCRPMYERKEPAPPNNPLDGLKDNELGWQLAPPHSKSEMRRLEAQGIQHSEPSIQHNIQHKPDGGKVAETDFEARRDAGEYVEIPLANGKYLTKFDVEFVEKFKSWGFSAVRPSSISPHVYVNVRPKARSIMIEGLKPKRHKAHRLVVDAKEGEVVDHINGDTLDNRKQNLRIVTAVSNARNRTAKKAGCTSRYIGVSRNERGEWVAQVSLADQPRHVYRGKSEHEAAAARDLAVIKDGCEYSTVNAHREYINFIADWAREDARKHEDELIPLIELERGVHYARAERLERELEHCSAAYQDLGRESLKVEDELRAELAEACAIAKREMQEHDAECEMHSETNFLLKEAMLKARKELDEARAEVERLKGFSRLISVADERDRYRNALEYISRHEDCLGDPKERARQALEGNGHLTAKK